MPYESDNELTDPWRARTPPVEIPEPIHKYLTKEILSRTIEALKKAQEFRYSPIGLAIRMEQYYHWGFPVYEWENQKKGKKK